MSTRFRSFIAAARRPNLHAFGLFPASQDLDWIETHGLEPTMGTVTGTVDGSNATFTIAELPPNVRVWVNGIKQIDTVDFAWTALTGTIVFTSGSIPMYGAYIEAECIGD